MSPRPRNRKPRPQRPQQPEVKPSVSRDELSKLKVAELREMARGLEIDEKSLKKKDELIDAVLEARVKSGGFIEVEGILDLLPEGYGFLRTRGFRADNFVLTDGCEGG